MRAPGQQIMSVFVQGLKNSSAKAVLSLLAAPYSYHFFLDYILITYTVT